MALNMITFFKIM